ncbi:MAG: cyclic pyranopterin monophosphate synthase MoaC [Bacteroidales bacterium]|nr:cyclic pyranopterin monophosphate synthase MoaC [Bacteroidales bacterium]
MENFSHINEEGKAKMVDVGEKSIQKRMAKAKGIILLQENTLKLIKQNEIKKGDVLTVAELAGIQAAKQTPYLIPLCHNLLLTKIEVQAKLTNQGVEIRSQVNCQGQTGVEMEALTAVSIALLTIYDMCKAVDKKMVLESVHLVEKTKKD